MFPWTREHEKGAAMGVLNLPMPYRKERTNNAHTQPTKNRGILSLLARLKTMAFAEAMRKERK
jgi:hypothetical protein